MAIIRRNDPFRDLVALQDQLFRTFDSAYRGSGGEDAQSMVATWSPLVDIFEDSGHRADHRGVDLQLAPRHFGAELLAERPGELLLLHQFVLEEVRAKTPAVKDLPVQRFLESFRSEMPAMDEHLADLRHLPSG